MTQNSVSSAVVVVSAGDWGPELDLVVGTGSFREMVGPRYGAQLRSMHRLELAPGSATTSLTHPADAVWFLLEGAGEVVDAVTGAPQPLDPGSVVLVRGGSSYRIAATADAVLVGGPCPVDPGLYDGSSAVVGTGAGGGIEVHHVDRPGLLVPFISRDARLVVWLGSGAWTANMNYVVLEPGERNTEHVHRYSEDTIHIVSGHGTAEDVTHGVKLPVGPGDTVHIPPGTWHAVSADRGERVVSVGGPCPADVDMLRAVGVDVDALLPSDVVVPD